MLSPPTACSVPISVPDWCFYGKIGTAERYYETLRDLGVEAVEMVPPDRYRQARRAGLKIINQTGPGMQQGLNRREHHPMLLPEIRESLRHCAEHAIPLLIVFSGNRAGQPDAEGIANCVRGLEQLLPEAERLQVALGFEMLCTADHPDYQACHGAYGFALCQRLPSPWLKLVYDIYHLSREGDDAAADVPPHIDRIAHLHLAESPQRSAPQADGNIAYRRIAPAILRAGYRGYWGLEFVPGERPLEDLRAAIAMLQRCAAM